MARAIRETPRRAKKRTPYPVIIIVCEGAKTEPIYFNHFKQRDKPLRIEVVKSAAGKSYQALIEKAIQAKEKYVAGTESNWTVWCVSDVDADHNIPNNQATKNTQLSEYAKLANSYGFKIALSNPCFELWFLLHFIYTTGYVASCDAVVKKLIEHLPEYQKSNDIYSLLLAKQTTAIGNARKLKQYHVEQGKSNFIGTSTNPYTNVWELIESLC